MPTTHNLVVILGHTHIDQMMHNMDVFEKSKRYALVEEATIELADGYDLATSLTKMRENIEKDPDKFAVAVFVKGNPAGAWYDTSCRTISNGQRFAVLEKVLKAYGYAGPLTETK